MTSDRQRMLAHSLFEQLDSRAIKWADMGAHMCTLAFLARHWSFAPIVECGVGKGFSTMAFLCGLLDRPQKLTSYDIGDRREDVRRLLEPLPEALDKWDFRIKHSVEASKDWPDKSLGLVFIDTAHTYDLTCQELAAWHPKVHPEGILCGHDYYLKEYTRLDGTVVACGVNQAVDGFAERHRDRYRLQVLPHDQGLFILWPRTSPSG